MRPGSHPPLFPPQSLDPSHPLLTLRPYVIGPVLGVTASSAGDSKQFVEAFTGGFNVLADNRTAATFAVP